MQGRIENMLRRRSFLQTGILGSAGLLAAQSNLHAHAAGRVSVQQQLDVPVVDRFDVVVAGAGPAGIAAALAAARKGAKTLLIEKNGCLGGIWTAGLLCWILDSNNKTGIMQEIRTRLDAADAGFANRGGNGAYAYDPEAMKLLLESLCVEANVAVRLGTWVVGGVRDERRMTHVISESKSGREAWQASLFVDCTGDGDLAARAGCGFDLGEPNTQAMQPMTLLALVGGVPLEKIQQFVRIASSPNAKRQLRAEIERSGVVPSYKSPGLYPLSEGLYMLMANHQYAMSGLDAVHLTEATLRARRETNDIVNGLRSLGSPWSDLRLVATAEQIGVREGRRIHGLYTVSTDDMVNGIRHADAVCRVHFGVDVHSTSLHHDGKAGGYSRGIKSKPYDVPLRALVAKDADGLMMAGRCISGDFLAHSSYRVTGDSVAMGEAAGQVAAEAAARGCLPQHVGYPLDADVPVST